MNQQLGARPAQAFFLQARQGQRFCLFYRPEQSARGALLYVHPFAEEMNKTRRMAALQARSFAQQGYAVLQIDLFGCGDSSGDFCEARWEIWRQDLELACDWLARQCCGPLGLWGLRLGALLALDFSADARLPVQHLILWQPVLSGKSHLNQFLRMRVASQMLANDGAPEPGVNHAALNNSSLRAELAAGGSIEVGGYELSAELAAAIDRRDAAQLAPRCTTHWFESTTIAGIGQTDGLENKPKNAPENASASVPLIAPAVARCATTWRDAGATLHLHPVCGAPFWATIEIAECPAMLAATTAAICT
ncbi:MAG: exosortase A-associated hydrolase 2 [Janthinobacterium sp.]|jgi:exosortase A-associated hydrolase 2